MHINPDYPIRNYINLHQTKHTLQAVITLSLISLALAVAGCDKNQLNAVPDAQPQDSPDSPVATDQESTADEHNSGNPAPDSQIVDTATNKSVSEQKPFKYTITTDIETTGTDSDNESFSVLIYVDSLNGTYPVLYDLDCESDGIYEFTGLTPDKYNVSTEFCKYKRNTGTHQISVRGSIPSIRLCAQTPQCPKKECDMSNESYFRVNPIVSIDSWGDIQWKSMNSFAENCVELNSIPKEAPDLSQVTDMYRMFYKAANFNQSLDNWDVSHVTRMESTFEYAESFNQPLEKWNVSNVTSMFNMFSRATSFNQSLNKWNVSNVTDMGGMFTYAESFNQSLDDWNVSNVISMLHMFSHATSFNQPLEKWDVSHVTSMPRMFEYAESFNQPLEKWNVSKVTNMSNMFMEAKAFNQPLGQWDVSSVEDMGGMFWKASSFDQPLDNWNISNVNWMNLMFYEARNFNHYPSSWVVPDGETDKMFKGSKVERLAKQKPLKTRKVKK